MWHRFDWLMLVDVSSMCSAAIFMVLQSKKRSTLVGLLDAECLRQCRSLETRYGWPVNTVWDAGRLVSCENMVCPMSYVVMRRVAIGIRSSKWAVGRFRRRANVYLHNLRLYSIGCSRLYGIAQCFSTFVRPRPGKLFFHKTRARSQQIYSSVPFQFFLSSYIKLT